MLLSLIILKLLTFFTIFAITSAEILFCSSDNFTQKLNSELIVGFYDNTLKINFDNEKIRFYGFPEEKLVSIRSKNVTINFQGTCTHNLMQFEYPLLPTKEIQIFTEEIIGTAQRRKFNDTIYKIFDYRLILLPDDKKQILSPMNLRNTIRRLAETCLEFYISEKFSKIDKFHFIETTGSDPGCILPSDSTSIAQFITHTPFDTDIDLGPYQAIINKIMDVTLVEVGNKLKITDDGSIQLPDINEQFTFLMLKGHFQTFNGTFRDITTLHRTANTAVSKKGNKYEASCGIGLSFAQIKFPAYKLKYLHIEVDGGITGSINGVALEGKISIDFSTNQCIKTINSMEITEFGLVLIQMTGLYPLNFIFSRLLESIVQSWRNNILITIQEQLIIFVNEELNKIDCEKFRP